VIRRLIPLLVLLLAAAVIIPILVTGRGEKNREDRFYPYDPTEIEAVDFIYPDRRLRIEYENGDWTLTAPLRDLTDRDTLLRIFGTLQSEPKPPMTVLPGDLDAMGLANPGFQVVLHRGERRDTLRYGSFDAESRRLYVQASWSDSIMRVSSLLRTNFMRNRYELSEKRPIVLEQGRPVRSIQLSNPSGEFALRKADIGWEMVGIDIFPADPAKVRDLTHAVSTPAILDFLDGDELALADLETPLARMKILQEGDSRPRELRIGPAYLNLHTAASPARSSAFLLDSLSVGAAFLPMRDFLPERLFEILPANVVRLSGRDWSLEQVGEGAVVWVDQRGEQWEIREVSRMIAFLAEISTRDVESMLPRADQLRGWGLDPPEEEIRFLERGRELVLQFGVAREGRRYFRREDYPVIYSLPEDELRFAWPGSGQQEH